MGAVVFCRSCRSERIDVRETRPDGAQVLACAVCGQTEAIRGFTVGRCGYSELGFSALPRLIDEARRDVVGWERRPRVMAIGKCGPAFERRGGAE